MNTIVHKRGAQGRAGQSATRIVLISAIFLATLSTAWLVGRGLFAPSAPVPADIYVGQVQLAPDQEGRCARFELDNRTGFMWPKGDARCGEVTTAVPARSSDGPMGRLNGIADHFKGR
jgi:hypothetical protein